VTGEELANGGPITETQDSTTTVENKTEAPPSDKKND